MNIQKSIFSAVLGMSILCSYAQTYGQDVLDGVYEKKIVKEKEYIPYDHIREADVFWSKRIFREIDVNEKMNLVFKFGGIKEMLYLGTGRSIGFDIGFPFGAVWFQRNYRDCTKISVCP